MILLYLFFAAVVIIAVVKVKADSGGAASNARIRGYKVVVDGDQVKSGGQVLGPLGRGKGRDHRPLQPPHADPRRDRGRRADQEDEGHRRHHLRQRRIPAEHRGGRGGCPPGAGVGDQVQRDSDHAASSGRGPASSP
jgi:hypothetical protein